MCRCRELVQFIPFSDLLFPIPNDVKHPLHKDMVKNVDAHV